MSQSTDSNSFEFSGGYSPEQLYALTQGQSNNARISKIELLKDTRTEDHWRHELLVFTVIHKERELYLYFERELDEDVEGLHGKTRFARQLFQGNALDNLEFHKPGGEKDVETKNETKPVFEIQLRSSPAFRLNDLAQILCHESYHKKYPKYGLFSANCWAWSRGLLLDIMWHPHASTAEILKTNGREMVPITLEEMRLYMLTEYGAFGRLILHFTSDGYKAQSPTFLNPYAVRIILLLYSILHTLVQWKRMIIGPSNWTTCLRKLLVYNDRTLEKSTEGQDCTYLALPPNFTDFISITPGHMDYSIPTSFCQPGRYLYLLTSPVCSSSQPVSAVHVYVFGATSDVPGNNHEENLRQDPSSWLSCGIIRRSEDDGALIEVARSHVRLISSPRGVAESSSPAEYSAINVFDSNHDFTRIIKHGDMIALWAHSYPGRLHTPRSASIKVVVTRPFRLIDWIILSCMVYDVGRSVYLRMYMHLMFSATGCLLYWTNTLCERWLWYNLSVLARTMHASATPLSLPQDSASVQTSSLPEFLQKRDSKAEAITSDILSASLCSIELFHENTGKEIVLVAFSHGDTNYYIHFTGPSAVNAGWLHYLSFFSTPHRLENDEIRIFQDGETERRIRESYVGQRILKIQFQSGGNASSKETTFKLELRSILERLQDVQKYYWWYFWLNSRYWTWQWWLLKVVLHETIDSQEFVEVEGRQCCRDEAAILLKDKHKQWRYAYMRRYERGLPRFKDVFFVATQTRSIWIVALIVTSSRALDWFLWVYAQRLSRQTQRSTSDNS